MRKNVIFFLILISIITGSAFLSRAAENYYLYFASEKDGDFDIYSALYPEKGDPKNLTADNPYIDTEPFVSRDGQKVVYVGFAEDGSANLFIMNFNGTGRKQLTSDGTSRMPSISYDGKKIVFVSERDGNKEIYIMDIDGSNQTRLTFKQPVSSITFPQARSDSPSLRSFEMVADLGPPEVECQKDTYPSFSPDGKTIVFTSYRDGNADLFLMGVDGSNQRHLTNTTEHNHNIQATFSPDGKKIVWASDRDGDYDLLIMDLKDPGKVSHLTSNGFGSHCPQYSRDGKKIFFCSELQGPTWDLFIMNSDGSNIESLYSSFGNDWSTSIY